MKDCGFNGGCTLELLETEKNLLVVGNHVYRTERIQIQCKVGKLFDTNTGIKYIPISCASIAKIKDVLPFDFNAENTRFHTVLETDYRSLLLNGTQLLGYKILERY